MDEESDNCATGPLVTSTMLREPREEVKVTDINVTSSRSSVYEEEEENLVDQKIGGGDAGLNHSSNCQEKRSSKFKLWSFTNKGDAKKPHTHSSVIKTSDEVTVPNTEPTRVYTRRWFILILFCLYSMSSAYQWIHLNIIFDVVKVYYNDSLPGSTPEQKSLAIDWLSMIYMLTYIPLIFPVTWLLDRQGLRTIAMIGTFLNALGAWLKCASVSPDRFMLLMAAQTVCASAQVFIIGMPARLAAVWFGPKQVSTATAIGVFGNQLGVAMGFVLPPYVVKLYENDLARTGQAMSYMHYAGAGYMTLLFILVVIVFRKEPPHPPSMAQYKIIRAAAKENYISSLKRLVKNWPFDLLILTYGLNAGVFYAIGTLLNPILLEYFKAEDFPNINQDAGWIGLTIVITGLFGSVVAGLWLDKTKFFKITTVIIYALSLGGMLAFTFTIQLKKIWIVFVTAGSLGFFMTGYLPVGFEFAAELTYPESEGTSSGLLNASAQAFGIALTLVMGYIQRLPGDEKSNMRTSMIVACGILLLGGVITLAIKNDLRRQHAEKDQRVKENSDNNEDSEDVSFAGEKFNE